MDTYEQTFGHRHFTGRSGSFFAYEGLGSIYWHMVSKLALSVLESAQRARTANEAPEVVTALTEAHADIRSGLGFTKTPADFGAFPADPYSHTPRHGKARQPGMTGQVKEDIVARFAELGLRVQDGRIRVEPGQVSAAEWTSRSGELDYVDVTGRERRVVVPAGALAFTFCQVPFALSRDSAPGITVTMADGSGRHLPGQCLSVEDSRHILHPRRPHRLGVGRIGVVGSG